MLSCTAYFMPAAFDLRQNHGCIFCIWALHWTTIRTHHVIIILPYFSIWASPIRLRKATHDRLWLPSHTLRHLEPWTRHNIECTFLALHYASATILIFCSPHVIHKLKLSFLNDVAGWCDNFWALYICRPFHGSKIWRYLTFYFNERLSHRAWM